MGAFSLAAAYRGDYPCRTGARACATHGQYAVREFIDTTDQVLGELPIRCPGCTAADELAEEQRAREVEIAQRFTDAKIPRRFWHCELTGFRTSAETLDGFDLAKGFADHWPAQKRTGESLILIGPVGTGKTHLAISVLKHVIRAGDRGRYCTVNELLREIRATWRGQGDRTEGQIIEYFGSMPLLVLDEVGASYGTDAERVILFDVLNERYEKMLPTIVCGNVTMEQLSTALDARSVDRLRENNGKAAILGGPSQRKVA